MRLKELYQIVKQEAKETGKRIIKHPGRILTTGALLFWLNSCGKVSPFEPSKEKDTGKTIMQNTSAYIFNGDTETENIKVSDKDGIYKSLAKIIRPDESIAETYTIKEEGTAVNSASKNVSVAYDNNGTWNISTETTDNLGNVSRETNQRDVYMNEEQSDINAFNIAKSLVTTISNDGNIIDAYGPDQNFDGYTNDIVLKVKMTGGSGFGFYCIDVQGSKTDIFDQTKKNKLNFDGVGYKHLKPEENIKNEISKLKVAGWPDMLPWIFLLFAFIFGFAVQKGLYNLMALI